MGHAECLAQSQHKYCQSRVHSAQCCLASACHAGVGLQSVLSVQLCCAAAAAAAVPVAVVVAVAVAVAVPNVVMQVAASWL